MSETIFKFQPDRTVALRGFDDLGASAAVHDATAAGFTVSGTFRDAADFAVVVLYDADNFYEHPRLKYLPDMSLDGLTLAFDVEQTHLMPLDSPKFATIDWPYLSAKRPNGEGVQLRLSDHATVVAGAATKAAATFTIEDNGFVEWDRVTLWYQNVSFDYLCPKVGGSYVYATGGVGTVHRVTVDGVDFTTTEIAGDTAADVAARLAALLAASAAVTAAAAGAELRLRAKRDDNASFVAASSAGANQTLHGVGPVTIAANLAAQINAVNWSGLGITIPVEAEAQGAVVTVRCGLGGLDGNLVRMISTAKNARLKAVGSGGLLASGPGDALAWSAPFAGGTETRRWRVTLDFAALGLPEARMAWLTFAPALQNSAQFAATEWKAVFTNWSVTGPAAVRTLKVAGPDAVRIEENDSWCRYSGSWTRVPHSGEGGFFSGGGARKTTEIGATVTVQYACPVVHEVWIGTALATGRGTAGVCLDGDAETDLDLTLGPQESSTEPVHTRRRVRMAVPAGEHTVTLRLKSAGALYFDFLEAANPSDIGAPLVPRPHFSPALDYSTDHTFKLSPSRLLWSFDQLGLTGPLNEYLGVFWWNQRKRVDAVVPSATVTLSGEFVVNDQVFLWIGGTPIGKSVFYNESRAVIAASLADRINATLVGVHATANGETVVVTARSPKTAYEFTFTTQVVQAEGSTGAISFTGSLTGGQPGRWVIDETAAPPLNRGAREWHADFYRQCATRNREVTTAVSLELVYPPASFAARYANGGAAETSVGFGSLVSTHCALGGPVLEFQKPVFLTLANLMQEAGVSPRLQCGEFLWWFFTGPDGTMAFYDAATAAAAQTALGRALAVFRSPDGEPVAPDAAFLRDRLRDHVAAIVEHVKAAHAAAKFEVLFPYDVNHPTPAGVHQLGGRLNRYVNFPAEWQTKAGSGLDALKMEALDFGAWSRNLDLAKTAIRFPIDSGWPRDSVRYLLPVFRAGWAWEREYGEAVAAGVPVIHCWAFDHVCLFGLEVREPRQPPTVWIT